jgi:hypothetical protein
MDELETHISQVFQGTMTHMAPGESPGDAWTVGRAAVGWVGIAAACVLIRAARAPVAATLTCSIYHQQHTHTHARASHMLTNKLPLIHPSTRAEIMLDGRVSKPADVYAFGESGD